jgi:hypothetical protein
MGGYRLVRCDSGSQGSGRRWWGRRAGVICLGLAVVGATTVVGVGIASGTTSPTPSVYSAITPVTVLSRSLAADSNTDVAVAGVGSVPSNATSVQLSVTALDGTTTSSMYVYPTGATKPTSANVRWETGETVTIPVTVAVGSAGKIHLSTDAGTVTVKVIVVGYFSPANAPTGAGYASQVEVIELSTSTTTTRIATLQLPAGSYQLQAKIVTDTEDSSDEVDCEIDDPYGQVVDRSIADVNGDPYLQPITLFGMDTTSGGFFYLNCFQNVVGEVVNAFDDDFDAIQLTSAAGSVSG